MSKTKIKTINNYAAGIDIGSEKIFVAVEGQPVKNFHTYTSGIIEATNFLKEHKIKTVAMEATGVYWIPIYEILEKEGFEVYVVNAYHVKNVPGRKSDVLDCQWIQELHSCGLLNSSFIPDNRIRELRSYVRLRDNHIERGASHIQHMQKAFDLMNIKLHTVISDIVGTSGMRIIHSILNGERDPVKLADLCGKQILDHKRGVVIESLKGNYRQEHLFLLKQGLECWEFYQSKIKECDAEIEKLLNDLTKDKDKYDSLNPPKKIKSHNKPEIEDLHGKLLMLTNGVDISVLPGLSDLSFMQLISELGINMDRWKSSKHFVSWLNLAPNISSSGKSKKKKKKKGFNYAGQIFREAALRGGNSKFLSISSFYKRIRARSGDKVANVATARKIAILFYNLLKHGLNYVEEGIEKAEKKFRERSIKSMEKRALDMGLKVSFQTIR